MRALSYRRTFRSSCLGIMVILLPSTLRIFPCRLINSPSQTSTLSPACRLCSRSFPADTGCIYQRLAVVLCVCSAPCWSRSVCLDWCFPPGDPEVSDSHLIL